MVPLDYQKNPCTSQSRHDARSVQVLSHLISVDLGVWLTFAVTLFGNCYYFNHRLGMKQMQNLHMTHYIPANIALGMLNLISYLRQMIHSNFFSRLATLRSPTHCSYSLS